MIELLLYYHHHQQQQHFIITANLLFSQTGSWISRIPDIKDQLNFSNTQLGLLMLVAAVGAILALPLSSGIIDCLGSARTLLMGNILLFVSLPLVGMSRLAGAIGGVFFLGKLQKTKWLLCVHLSDEGEI